MRQIQSTIDSVTLHSPWLRPVSHDLFDISKRIRDIDEGYFIVRNTLRGDFEVHHVDNKGPDGTYSLTLPYDRLDARTLDYVARRDRQNTKKFLAEIEAANKKIDLEKQRDSHNIMESATIELANDLRRAL